MFPLSYEVESKIHRIAEGLLENVFYDFPGQISSPETLREAISEEPITDTDAIGLSLDQQVQVLEILGEEELCDFSDVDLQTLRSRIEAMTCLFLHLEAERRALEVLDKFLELLDVNQLSIDQVRTSDPFDWAAYHSQREEDGVTIYEYRHVEGTNVDVWHFRSTILELFICEPVDSEELE